MSNVKEPHLYWVSAAVDTPLIGMPVIVEYQTKRGRYTLHICLHTGDDWVFLDTNKIRRSDRIVRWANVPR